MLYWEEASERDEGVFGAGAELMLSHFWEDSPGSNLLREDVFAK